MEFEVYVLCEIKSDELINVWTGSDFAHPAEMSPYYFNKREVAGAYRLMSNRYADRLALNQSDLKLEKFTFIYNDPISTYTPPPEEAPEDEVAELVA